MILNLHGWSIHVEWLALQFWFDSVGRQAREWNELKLFACRFIWMFSELSSLHWYFTADCTDWVLTSDVIVAVFKIKKVNKSTLNAMFSFFYRQVEMLSVFYRLLWFLLMNSSCSTSTSGCSLWNIFFFL